MPADPLVPALRQAVRSQLAALERLAARVPAGAEGWRPPVPEGARPGRSTAELLGHLLDAATGIAAVLRALRPERLAGLDALRRPDAPLPASRFRAELDALRGHLERAFDAVDDADLGRRIPSMLVGEATGLGLMLGALDHLACHREELLLHLRLQGVEVGTAELYALQGAGGEPGAGA